METQLSKSTSGYLVGDKCTIADIACWGWVASSYWAGISLDEFPLVNAWLDKVVARPGCEKGRHVPKPHKALENRHKTEAELEKAAEQTRAWVQAGMKEDAKK
ncbi:hypothetical protein VTI74DRAFT_6006 [Chaetomium olivicolor]